VLFIGEFIEFTVTFLISLLVLELSVAQLDELLSKLVWSKYVADVLAFVWFTDAALVVLTFKTNAKLQNSSTDKNNFLLILPPPSLTNMELIIL